MAETDTIGMPQLWVTRIYLSVANAHLGRMEEARAQVAAAVRLYPMIAKDWDWQVDIHNYSANFRTVMTEGLRKAGLFDTTAGK